ncbi:reverse transcriptase domain-containing protein [Artemisia annua]|uniref:Reverse transcriptase domain-containing protein n=1 Tax=Artemisia annua TaxID=35608 RepID=A0A2U1PAL3_ARTAN|nr:reverse transcriptase domain-containing protein [Artemisia annua]
MEEAALFFDKGLRGSIENIVVCGGPYFGDLQWHLASLPIRFGGLGLYSAKNPILMEDFLSKEKRRLGLSKVYEGKPLLRC